MNEAPLRWQEYGESLRKLQGNGSFILSESIGSTGDHRAEIIIKQNKHSKLCIRQFTKTHEASTMMPKGYVWGFNARYAFFLQRKDKNTGWTVTELAEGESGDSLRKRTETTVDVNTRWLLNLAGDELSDLVKQERFRITRIEKVKRQESDLVRVDFDNTHPVEEEGKEFFSIQKGSITLDPRNHWCLCLADLATANSHSTGKRRIETEYRTGSRGLPIPVKFRMHSESQIEGRLVTPRINVDLDLDDGLPIPDDAEFTLAAFGLPEPPPRPKGGPTLFLWLAAAGMICIAVGAWLTWRWKKTT